MQLALQTHTPIEGRSIQQHVDDDICEAHSELTKMLNMTHMGRLLYTGERAKALMRLRDQCEAYIRGEGPAPDRIFSRIFYVCQLGR